MNRRTVAALTALAALTSLGGAACSSAEKTPTDGSGSTAGDEGPDDHGAIQGATEVAEPPLHLMSVDVAGEVGLLDLLDGTTTDVGRISPPTATATDGRYLFATTAEGLEVVDSGTWTWDHGDHFHYYRSAPELVGTVPGGGAPTVAPGPLSTSGGTGVFFPGSGEAVLLDHEALDDGEPGERFRIRVAPHDGLVAPLGDGAVLSVPDRSGAVRTVRRHDADGSPVAGSETRCRAPRGSTTTVVGLVVGCADGALLFTGEGERWVVERIPYPRGADAPRAVAFEAREGRPTVAALAGPRRFWLLDTRERAWQLLDAGAPLLEVSAADDEDGHVVALDRAGRVRVYLAPSGREVAVTRPLVAAGADGRLPPGVDLVVDDQRTYLGDPGRARVLEIDHADGARVARVLTTPTRADFFAEVGR